MGSANQDYPNISQTYVGHRESVLTLIGAGLNGGERQVGIVGDTHVFGEVDYAGKLDT